MASPYNGNTLIVNANTLIIKNSSIIALNDTKQGYLVSSFLDWSRWVLLVNQSKIFGGQ